MHTDAHSSPYRRLSVFTDRLRSLTPHPATAVPAVKAAMRGFRASESSARDLISTVWTILDQNLDDTASVINAVVDLIEEEDKKTELLSSWNGFKIEVC
jgi:E3 ubiquitin-protein ligase ZNF598